LRRASGKALRIRLHRRNKRGTTNFFFDRRVKAKRRYVPRRVWRQGRRGYAGLFGKRRYRAERRDKQLARRTSKRSVTRRTLLVRSILSQKTYRASNEHSIRYKAATAVQLLTSIGEKPAKLLAANAQQSGYDTVRYLAAPRLRRSKQRARLSAWPMKRPVGRALLMRTSRTAFAFLQGGNYKLLRDVLANKKTFYALPRKHDYRR
jgi:hypothetical protein